MKPHLQRVLMLKFSEEIRANQAKKDQIRKEHARAILFVWIILFAFAFFGAWFPDIYAAINKTPPVVQVIIPVIPLVVFTIWRIRRMIRL